MTVESDDHDLPVGDFAVSEIVAGIAVLRGPKGLEDLVVDLARRLADLIERIAATEGLAPEDIADVLLFDERPGSRAHRGGVAAIRLHERCPRSVGRPR